MKSVYNRIFYKTNSEILSKVLTPFLSCIFIIYYVVKKLTLKNTLNISIEQADREINKIYKRPNGGFTYNIRKIDEKLDLSIIVSAYNVSKYIEDCMKSVLNQETKYNYEVIVIDDGSTDNTLSILQKYKDDYILKIISQENKGFSGARNVGIDIAKGKYLMFLDSDDLLEKNSIQVLLETAYKSNASIVEGGYVTFLENFQNKRVYTKSAVEIDPSNRRAILKNSGFAWGKIYENKLFDKVRFPLNYWFEDTIIHYVIYRSCGKFVRISDIVYNYRINLKGITATHKESIKSLDTYWIVEEVVKIANELGIKNDNIMYKFTLFQLSNMLYCRLATFDKSIIKNVFILASNFVKDIKPKDNVKMTLFYRDVEKAFLTQNYELWELCSKVISID